LRRSTPSCCRDAPLAAEDQLSAQKRLEQTTTGQSPAVRQGRAMVKPLLAVAERDR
jgi:hypothetical protein